MEERKCLVLIPFNEKQKKRIMEANDQYQYIFTDMAHLTLEEVKDVEIILGNVDPNFLVEAKNLKWLQTNSAGVNQYIDGVLPVNTLLSSSVGAYDVSVTEGMIASTMDLYRKMPAYMSIQKKHLWEDLGPVQSPCGATILIVGAGRIGSRYAKIMKAMGSRIIGIKKDTSKIPEYMDEIYGMDDLHQCLQEADLVASILPATKATERVFGMKEFQCMKSTAYFLNFGRGNSVITEDLCQALENGIIAGAALDVTNPEPLPANHPLWDAPNLILTPHISGSYHIEYTLEAITEICVENLKHFQLGERLRNQVDPSKGY